MVLLVRLYSLVNWVLIALIALSAILFCSWKWVKKGEEIPVEYQAEHKELPKNPFSLAGGDSDLAKGPLKLIHQPAELELPDLKEELLFLGKNERPDVKESGQFYLSLRSSGETKLCRKGRPVYLRYQKSADLTSKGRYSFSSEESPFWVMPEGESGGSLQLSLFLHDETGKIVVHPQEHQRLTLAKAESAARAPFEIGGVRVDGMLFFRQKARLAGRDQFLARHGGEEFADNVGRERIDFLIEDGGYSCFMKPGDLLIWKEGRWQRSEEGQSSASPLLHVLKADDKSMQFEIWDVEGRTRVPLTLVRSPVHELMPDISQEFKFIGAKTWAQFLLECRGARMVLRLGDWLLLTEEGWQKIDSAEKLDAFVDRKLSGALFVLDKWEKREGRQQLLGHLFNRDRTEVQEIELAAFVASELPTYGFD